LPKGASDELIDIIRDFKRQALHAAKLGLIHPKTGEEMQWQVAVPADMQKVLDALAEDVAAHEQSH